MKIAILSVIDKKPSWAVALEQQYLKRFPKHWQITQIQVSPSTLAQETDKFNQQITRLKFSNSIQVALCIEGKPFSSEMLAQKIEDWQQRANNLIIFIGGADGLSETIKQQCHFRWSLSQLTLPHVFAQVLLIEQLYRSYAIQHNLPYHKGHI